MLTALDTCLVAGLIATAAGLVLSAFTSAVGVLAALYLRFV